MTEDEETYCRLCAEPTPRNMLIGPEEDVATSSKIVAKLLWINVDISLENLPNTICFSCFDLLERAWLFLNNARLAHEKLTSIFVKNHTSEQDDIKSESQSKAPGKPVNKDWEMFIKVKVEVKDEDITSVLIEDSNDSNLNKHEVKRARIKEESDSDHDYDPNGHSGNMSSDSDVPLEVTAKKKQAKLKKIKDSTSLDNKHGMPFEILSSNITWDDQPCRCAKCDALFNNVTSLQIHSLKAHEQCSTFKCIECNKVLNNFKFFARHMRTHVCGLNHCCEHCNKLFLLTKELVQHKAKMHKSVYKTKCRSCGSVFDTKDELQKHKLEYGKRYKQSRNRPTDFKCTVCNKVYKSRDNLKQHKIVHTPRTRDFACHICGKLFFTKGALGTHMFIHEDKKPFKCEFCPMAFRSRGNLISHSTLHFAAKPFVCEQCGKSFRCKRHLKSHSIMHTDLRPFECQFCNKSFRFKTRLNLHLRQHTGAKPYNCVHCQRDFTNGSNYKKHMRIRHGIDTSSRKLNYQIIETDESNSNVEKSHQDKSCLDMAKVG